MNDDSAATATGAAVEPAALARAEEMLADDPETRVARDRQAEVEALGERIVEALKTVFDPEIPVNIYELGLIYKVEVEDDDKVLVEMTLTSPNCPVAESLPQEVEHKVAAVEGANGCEVKIVWDPPWNPTMMTEEAQLELGMIY